MKIGFLAKTYADFTGFHNFPSDLLKIVIFENLTFLKIDYLFTFDWYFEAWEHQNRTRDEKILPGSYSEIFWPDGKLIGARRRSKSGPRGGQKLIPREISCWSRLFK